MKFSLYQGKYTRLERGLAVGESVVNNLGRNFVPEGSNGSIDNFFTTLHHLEKIRSAGKNVTRIIHNDRIRGLPLSDFEKNKRGESEVFVEDSTGKTTANQVRDRHVSMNGTRRHGGKRHKNRLARQS